MRPAGILRERDEITETTEARILWVSAGSAELDGRAVFANLPWVKVEAAANGLECLRHISSSTFDAVIASFPLPDWTAGELLEEAKRIEPSLPFLVRDAEAKLADVMRLTKLGADYFFGALIDPEEMTQQLERFDERRRSREIAALATATATAGEPWRQMLVGSSRAMEEVCTIVRLIGAKRCTVLITGETGTGKEMVARALHMAGARAHLPMVAVNCSALPENLLEAELFGHVKGAFTGAMQQRVGRFEQAHRSTIFLDEVGDVPLDLQSKLLRVLQEREFQRIGSSDTIRVDVRVVAATNVDLGDLVKQRKFREDLFYRLNVVPIRMPALRERISDIPMLAHHFLDKVCRFEQIPIRQVTPEALQRLAAHDWPGNVRQLENAVEMAVALSGDRQILYPADFPLPLVSMRAGSPAPAPGVSVPDGGLDFERTVNDFERSILRQALEKTSGNKKQAADMLRLKRTTLSAKLKTLEASA